MVRDEAVRKTFRFLQQKPDVETASIRRKLIETGQLERIESVFFGFFFFVLKFGTMLAFIYGRVNINT